MTPDPTRGAPVRYGRGIARGLGRRLGPAIVVAHPEPWSALRDDWGPTPVAYVEPVSLDRRDLEAIACDLPACDLVVGIGGGSAMDIAKWLHWRRGIELHLVPSLPSVDACFTREVATRDQGRVSYVGDAAPAMVHVDFELMRRAPVELLRAGVGDVLSCHTARFDWALAVERGIDAHPWDPDAAAASIRLVGELEAIAPLVRDGHDDGLRRLMEAHREIGWRCRELGHARFEEGSEHFFAYCFEHVTGRTILHGELVTIGALIMATLQGNDPQRVRQIVAVAGTRHSPETLPVTWDELDATMHALPAFVRDRGHWYSQVDELTVDPRALRAARAALA